jgi:hypothetical protein
MKINISLKFLNLTKAKYLKIHLKFIVSQSNKSKTYEDHVGSWL